MTIPDSVTSIGSYAFEDCTSLTSVTIPDSITSIGSSAFYGCTSLVSVTIPNSVTSIGSSAFRDCTSLTIYCEAASEPSGWSSNWNYSNRPVILGYTGSNGVTDDGLKWASVTNGIVIYGYSGTNNEIAIPEKINGIDVVLINQNAFRGNTIIASVTISDSVTSIGSSAFYGCTSLTSVTIPDSVTSIGEYAFAYCDSLTSVTIPDSVTSIGSYAFRGCSSLTIYCEATSKPSGWNSDWNYPNRPVVWGYTGEEYTYNFVTNGGEEIESVTADRTFALPTPAREGWYFDGWYDNAELYGNPVSSPYYSKTAHTLYAKWMTEEEYLASLDGSSFEKAYIITSGESLPAVIDTAGEYVYFVFTATESKTYTFQSNGSYDTYGYLYNSSQSQITYNDDGVGSNFKITHSMSAGETVYLKVKLYSSSSTGTFTVTVS